MKTGRLDPKHGKIVSRRGRQDSRSHLAAAEQRDGDSLGSLDEVVSGHDQPMVSIGNDARSLHVLRHGRVGKSVSRVDLLRALGDLLYARYSNDRRHDTLHDGRQRGQRGFGASDRAFRLRGGCCAQRRQQMHGTALRDKPGGSKRIESHS